MLRYCTNLKAIRYESTSLNRIVTDKSHRVIVALLNKDQTVWSQQIKESCLIGSKPQSIFNRFLQMRCQNLRFFPWINLQFVNSSCFRDEPNHSFPLVHIFGTPCVFNRKTPHISMLYKITGYTILSKRSIKILTGSCFFLITLFQGQKIASRC